MVTEFIEKKEVRDLLKKYFPKPKHIANPIIITEKATNPSKIGNAFELFIMCYYDFLFYRNKKSILNNAFMIELNDNIEKSRKIKINLLSEGFTDIIEKTFHKIKSDKNFETNQLNKNPTSEYLNLNDYLPIVKVKKSNFKTMNNLDKSDSILTKFIPIYKEYLKSGILTKTFLHDLLSLGNFSHPLYFIFAKNNNLNYSVHQKDITILNELIKQIPKDFFGSDNTMKIKSQKALMSGYVNGRPDFIHNKKIIEIKATTAFFTQNHYHQILAYFLLYINDQAIQCATNYTKNDFLKECDIRYLQIYYPYFNQSVIINVEDLYDVEDFNIAYNEFIKLTDEYFID
jgi:hypothetical protein